MIAQRFRSVAWVAGVALAATLLYIISLQVATERGRLEAVDKKIAATKRDIRQLQTELGTRGSLRQLERWNSEVLALSAPGASQFLTGEEGISEISRDNLGDASAAPPPVMAAVMVREDPAPTAPTEAASPALKLAQAAAAPVARITAPKKPALSAQDKVVQRAVAGKSSEPAAPVRVASTDKTLLDRASLGEIARAARAEVAQGGKPKP